MSDEVDMPDEIWIYKGEECCVGGRSLEVADCSDDTDKPTTLYRRADAPLPDDVRAAVERIVATLRHCDEPDCTLELRPAAIADLRTILTHLQEKL